MNENETALKDENVKERHQWRSGGDELDLLPSVEGRLNPEQKLINLLSCQVGTRTIDSNTELHTLLVEKPQLVVQYEDIEDM